MKPRPDPDRLLFVAALLLAMGTAAWFGWKWLRSPLPPVVLTGTLSAPAAYAGTGAALPVASGRSWERPGAQQGGRDWIYEVFSPPEIFYDPQTRRFTASPPQARSSVAAAAFGVQLVSVFPEAYPLQLTGFLNGQDGYRGIFENLVTGETMVAGEGRRIDSLGLSVIRLSVVRREAGGISGGPLGVAVVRGDRAGSEVRLEEGDRLFTGFDLAEIRSESGEQGVVREGQSFEAGGALYTVEKIRRLPPEVDIVKKSSDSAAPERRTLSP